MNENQASEMKYEESQADTAQSPQPLVRVFVFGPLQLEWQVAPSTQEALWSGRTSARALFLLLLFAPDRQANRSQLASILWPETEERHALESLRSALKVLRKVLSTTQGEELLETPKSDVLKLPDQSRLWVDMDAFEILIEQANKQPEMLSLWQQASAYWQGELLAEDHMHEWVAHRWIKIRRKKLYAARRRMIRHLAQGYLLAGQRTQAEAVLSTHIAAFPTDQDALYLLMKLLIEEGCFDEARSHYELCQYTLARYEKQPAKHLQALKASLNTLHSTPTSLQKQPLQLEDILAATNIITEDLTFSIHNIPEITSQQHQAVQGAYRPEIPSDNHTITASDLDTSIRSRRYVLQGIVNATCAALIFSPYLSLRPDSKERLMKTLNKSAYLEKSVIDDLSIITEKYWQLSVHTSLPLLNAVSGHLQTITQLLYEGQSAHLHCLLCTLASETAQILGKILFDLCEPNLAWAYYSLSLKAAEEAKHTELWSVGIGRMALLLAANGRPQEALSILQEAQQKSIENNLIRSWISTVEAEVHADQHNLNSCLNALYRAKESTTNYLWEEDVYATGFNLSRLAGYEGSCYLRLEQPVKALPALQRALSLLEPGSLRRRSRLFTYISEAYAQLGDIQSVEQYASQALALTVQTGSLSVLQRIQELYERLEQWKETSSVKSLEEQLRNTKLIIINRQEMQ